jgi:hypothetical protein
MIKSALWDLQQALYQTLISDSELTKELTGGIFDSFLPVGENQIMADDDLIQLDAAIELTDENRTPYLVLGDDTVADYSSKTFHGEEITHTMHIWSDYGGKMEVKRLLDLTLRALTKEPITINEEFVIDDFKRDFMEVLPEGELFHGILRIRCKIKQL